MKGDRVVVGTGYYWKESDDQKVMVYKPSLNQQGQIQETPDGCMIVERAGGIKAGSTGVIMGDVKQTHKSYLHDTSSYVGMADKVTLVPVFLDKYQQPGWFPIDNIRIFGFSQ